MKIYEFPYVTENNYIRETNKFLMAVKTLRKKRHIYKLAVEYLTDRKGNKTKIVIPLKDFNKFLQRIEYELDIKIANEIMKNNPRFSKYDSNDYK